MAADCCFLLSAGQNLYGRVLWSPSQDLKAAYKLTIEKVYLCTGTKGTLFLFDVYLLYLARIYTNQTVVIEKKIL